MRKGSTREGGYRGGFARSTSARGQVGCERGRGDEGAHQAKGEKERVKSGGSLKGKRERRGRRKKEECA